MVKVSVIILCWNSRKWLKDCLSSILSQIFADCEIIMVDSGSTDGSVEYTRAEFPMVKIRELGRNYGFAEGNNQGARIAGGEYLIFVNTDTKAEDGWLRSLVSAADNHPDYAILCSIQTPSQERNRPRVLNAYGLPMASPSESEKSITDSLFASGAVFLIRRKWLQKIGYLFDSFYSAYAEDLELSLRTVLLGGRIGYVHDSRIYHFVGGAGLPSSTTSFLASRNVLLTYYKLLETRNFARVFLVHILYIISRLFLRKEQLFGTLSMARGTWAFLFSFQRYSRFRHDFLARKRNSDAYIFRRFVYRGKIENLILKHGIFGC